MPAASIFDPTPAKGWLPWSGLAPVLGLLFAVVPQLALTAPMLQLHLLDAKEMPIGTLGWLAFLIVPFAGTAALVFGWAAVVERRSLATLGLGPGPAGRDYLRGQWIGMGTALLVVVAIAVSGGATASEPGKALHQPLALLQIALFLVAFALQSASEELLFRGWLLSTVARRRNVPVAILLSTMLFTLLHLNRHQPWLVTANTALFSVFCCCWVLVTRDLWGVMGWHGGWNWLLAVGFEQPITGMDTHMPALLVKLTPQGPRSLTGGAEGPEGSFYCSAFFLLAIAFLLVRLRRQRAVPPELKAASRA